MSKQTTKSLPSKGSHLRLEDRAKIEYGLNKGHSIRAISREIRKAPSTVMREIQRNNNYTESSGNVCEFLGSCNERHVCGNITCNSVCSKKCRSMCYIHCPAYSKYSCDKLKKPPHVCNGCSRLANKSCDLEHYVYSARDSHNKYRETLKERRNGFDLTLGKLVEINNKVSPLIMQGQSPYHIMRSNELGISLSTLYRLIGSGELDARDIDLAEKVKRKPRSRSRHSSQNTNTRLQEAKVGHMYGDFLKYMDENDTFYVEMDCVVGKLDESPAILTLHYPLFHFQYAVYLPIHDSEHVVDALNWMEAVIGTDMFIKMFPVILTDNGSEFSRIYSMEASNLDPFRMRTKVFFCEPNRSDEKGSCENNHKMIRKVIPKGRSLLNYDNYDMVLMMNHINSYRRNSALGKSAFDLVEGVFPREFLDALGCYRIPDNEIVLKPELLRSRHRK